MQKDLSTSIFAAIVGVLIAYFVTNMFLWKIEDYPVKIIDGSVDTQLVSPNPEVFNYKALNPTVEVYVGDCTQINEAGECLDDSIINQGNQ